MELITGVILLKRYNTSNCPVQMNVVKCSIISKSFFHARFLHFPYSFILIFVSQIRKLCVICRNNCFQMNYLMSGVHSGCYTYKWGKPKDLRVVLLAGENYAKMLCRRCRQKRRVTQNIPNRIMYIL